MEEKKLVLGLDIGVVSVGWGLINIGSDEVVASGVRLFPERDAKNNVNRRAKRSSRRVLRRKQNRLIELKKLFIKEGLIGEDFMPLDNPYLLRAKGVRGKLGNEELVTAILHIAKRRGSVLDVVEDDEEKAKELGKAKNALMNNEKELISEQNLYVCDIQLKRLGERGYIRGTDNIFKLESYTKEAKKILENAELNKEIIEEIIKIISRKREYYEGPGSAKSISPYGRFIIENGEVVEIDLIEKMRGKCSVYPDQVRAPKMSYSADLFNLLNDLNNLRMGDEKISPEQKNEILEKFIKPKGNITPKQLLKFLNLDNESELLGFKVNKKQAPILTEFKGYKIIKKCVDENSLNTTIYTNSNYIDEIVEILTKTKGVNERKEKIRKIDPEIFDSKTSFCLANISGVSGYHSLSMKAIKEMNEEMLETSLNQMEILTKNNAFANKNNKLKGLKNIPFDETDIISPVAKRAQQETVKIVNAIRKEYGELDTIVIETAREKNSEEQRKQIIEMQKIGEELNEKYNKIAEEQGVVLNLKTKHKVRLYEEQNAKCLYCGKALDLRSVINDEYAYDIDHVIPISISLDDSMNNKVVVHADCNRKKSNMTPFQYMSSGTSVGWTYNEFKSYVWSLKIKKKKKENLTYEKDINKFSVLKEFINRNLVDTRYASRMILNRLTTYFKVNEIPTKVHTVRGQITDMFRKKAQIDKDRDEFKHHAVDALIVAAIKKKNLLKQFLNIEYDNRNDLVTSKITGELITFENEKEFFDEQLIDFIKKLRNHEPKFSHKVDKKPNRKFTDETIYCARNIDGEFKRIASLKNIYDKEGKKLADMIKNGEEDKILMKQEDPKTFEIIKSVVYNTPIPEGGKEDNPFKIYFEANGKIRKYSKKGKGPEITNVKYIMEKLGNHKDISHKYELNKEKTKVVLLQLKPYRTDFYKCSDDLIKFVTVRYANVFPEGKSYKIPTKWYEEAKVSKGIDEKSEFICSLHTNEVFEIIKEDKNKIEEREELRFVATNNDEKKVIEARPLYRHKALRFNAGKISEIPQLVITINKDVKSIKKIHVDVLGNKYQVNEKLVLQL